MKLNSVIVSLSAVALVAAQDNGDWNKGMNELKQLAADKCDAAAKDGCDWTGLS